MSPQASSARARQLLTAHIEAIWRSTDRLFGLLMILQYVGAVVWALLRSPRTWDGATSSIHPHVFVAVGLGGLIAVPTVLLAFFYTGKAITRWTISVTQLLMSAMLIHVSGGRIETHFHVFVSLAFIAFYRDWRLLIPGTLVTLFDHILRGLYNPSSVYGVGSGAEWRFIEHAAWVVFEDVTLTVSCLRGRAELQLIADRQAELESAKEAAEAANRTKSQFLAGMSHELRTPLNAVIGFAELIKNPSFGELQPRQSDFVDHIHTSGKHLLDLINSVLDLAKVESGTVELHCEDLSITAALDEIVNVVQPIAQKKHIELVVRRDPDLPSVRADSSKVRQVLYNVVSNAVKFSELNSTVVLSARRADGPFIEVEVKDNGIGISPADQERVFRQFEQVDGSYARKQQGTGLGLALCRSIVELHGGRIWVESEGEGRGSSFKFLLPMSETRTLTQKPASSGDPVVIRPSKDSLLVLVVEDNSANRELVENLITTAGHRVLQAPNAEAGIKLALDEKPDVILMDISMPDIDGLAATRMLLENTETRDIPVIALTAQAMVGDREAALEAGCVDYITKPFDAHGLLQTLLRVTSQRRAA